MRAGSLTLAVVIGVLFTLSGCLQTALAIRKAIGVGLEDRMKPQHPETGREIVMLGMVHLGEPQFFEEVKNSPYQKIVLLYGKGHWYGLYSSFRGTGFQITEGKL
jgi:hypothetical protein